MPTRPKPPPPPPASPIFIFDLTRHFHAGPGFEQSGNASQGDGNRRVHRIITLCAPCRCTGPHPESAVTGHPWLRLPVANCGPKTT